MVTKSRHAGDAGFLANGTSELEANAGLAAASPPPIAAAPFWGLIAGWPWTGAAAPAVSGGSLSPDTAVLDGGGTSGSGLVLNASTQVTDDNSDLAMNGPTARATYGVDGTGIKIGILSDSFNALGGMATDIANGDLPAATTILQDDPSSGGTDEGRAMADLVHRVAPGAQIYFYSAEGGQSAMASGIAALANAGCNIIIDDATYLNEPFYQAGGIVSQAVASVVAAGKDYFTSAGNNGADYYEAQFNGITYNLPGVGSVLAHNVGGGSPYETAYIASSAGATFDLQWTQPFASLGGAGSGGSSYGIGVAVYSVSNGTPTFLFKSRSGGVGADPVNVFTVTTPGTIELAFYEDAGTVAPGTFKTILLNSSASKFTGPGAGVGSGSSFGHNSDPSANTVGAIYYGNTPAFGVATPVQESFSSYGGGKYYYDANGNLLATPQSLAGPTLSAPDGSVTSVFNPFFGTSAAAPDAAAVGALMLQEDSRLTTAQVSYLLQSTAVATGHTVNGGAGLVDANAAVGGAHTAITTPIFTGQGGSLLWSVAANWSDNSAPAGAVTISNGIGLFTSRYTVTDDVTSASISQLTLGGVGGATPLLSIGAGNALAAGSVSIGLGTLDVAGSLTASGALTQAAQQALAEIEQHGRLSIGTDLGVTTRFVGVGGNLTLTTTNASDLLTGQTGTIDGFAAGDTLDLAGLTYAATDHITSDGTFAYVRDSGGTLLAQLNLPGSFPNLSLAPDLAAGSGTLIVTCFLEGTRVATPCGERAVEDLRAGDLVLTAEGAALPVRFIGVQTVATRFADPLRVLPIRVRAGALAANTPRRDLLLSPGHALLLDGLLIQVGALVNGGSIAQVAAMPETFRYYHVELPTHAAILAEGAPAESFLDGLEDLGFDNARDRALAAGEAPTREMACPRVKSARQVPPAIRARLAARAAGLGFILTRIAA